MYVTRTKVHTWTTAAVREVLNEYLTPISRYPVMKYMRPLLSRISKPEVQAALAEYRIPRTELQKSLAD